MISSFPQTILSSSLMIIAILIFRKVLKERLSLKMRYLLWALVALRLLVPVEISFEPTFIDGAVYKVSGGIKAVDTLLSNAQPEKAAVIAEPEITGAVNAEIDNQTIDVEAQTQEVKQTLAAEEPVTNAETEHQSRTGEVLRIVWVMGMLGIFALMMHENLWFSRKFVKRSRSADQTEKEVYDRLRQELKIKNSPDLMVTKETISPCLIGAFHPCILIPEAVIKNETMYRFALLHELYHFKHKDNWMALLRNFCCILYWFNPLVWMAAESARQDSEVFCDEKVLSKLPEEEHRSYGAMLISLVEKRAERKVGWQEFSQRLNVSTTMSTDGKKLKNRIELIMQRPGMKKLGILGVIGLAIIISVGVFTALYAEPLPIGEDVHYSMMPVGGLDFRLDEDESLRIIDGDEERFIFYKNDIRRDIGSSLLEENELGVYNMITGKIEKSIKMDGRNNFIDAALLGDTLLYSVSSPYPIGEDQKTKWKIIAFDGTEQNTRALDIGPQSVVDEIIIDSGVGVIEEKMMNTVVKAYLSAPPRFERIGDEIAYAFQEPEDTEGNKDKTSYGVNLITKELEVKPLFIEQTNQMQSRYLTWESAGNGKQVMFRMESYTSSNKVNDAEYYVVQKDGSVEKIKDPSSEYPHPAMLKNAIIFTNTNAHIMSTRSNFNLKKPFRMQVNNIHTGKKHTYVNQWANSIASSDTNHTIVSTADGAEIDIHILSYENDMLYKTDTELKPQSHVEVIGLGNNAFLMYNIGSGIVHPDISLIIVGDDSGSRIKEFADKREAARHGQVKWQENDPTITLSAESVQEKQYILVYNGGIVKEPVLRNTEGITMISMKAVKQVFNSPDIMDSADMYIPLNQGLEIADLGGNYSSSMLTITSEMIKAAQATSKIPWLSKIEDNYEFVVIERNKMSSGIRKTILPGEALEKIKGLAAEDLQDISMIPDAGIKDNAIGRYYVFLVKGFEECPILFNKYTGDMFTVRYEKNNLMIEEGLV